MFSLRGKFVERTSSTRRGSKNTTSRQRFASKTSSIYRHSM